MKRFLKLHASLTVPEDGTVVRATEREDGSLGVEVFCAGHAKTWAFVGDVAMAIMAFVGGLQTFPVSVANGRETVDIPAGWQESQAARGMMAQVDQGLSSPLTGSLNSQPNYVPQTSFTPTTAKPAWQEFVAPPAPQVDFMPLQASDVPMIDEAQVAKALRGELYD